MYFYKDISISDGTTVNFAAQWFIAAHRLRNTTLTRPETKAFKEVFFGRWNETTTQETKYSEVWDSTFPQGQTLLLTFIMVDKGSISPTQWRKAHMHK